MSRISGKVLKNVLFPVGGLLKNHVKEIAHELGLPVAKKKESMGICFIGKRDFKEFLSQYISNEPGYFKNLYSGQVLGMHRGLSYYTIGQNSLLGGQNCRMVVQSKCKASNVIYLVPQGDASLRSKWLLIKNFEWINGLPESLLTNENLTVSVRSSEKVGVRAFVSLNSENSIRIDYPEGIHAVAPGQTAVLYQGEVCLGGGMILQTDRNSC